MKVSNIVISTVVAISAAGALGLAYAQSATEPQPETSAPMSQDATPTTQDATPAPETMDQAPSGTASQDSGTTMSQDSPDATRSDSTYNERVARADRN